MEEGERCLRGVPCGLAWHWECLPLHGQGGTSPGENRLCYKIIEGSVD